MTSVDCIGLERKRPRLASSFSLSLWERVRVRALASTSPPALFIEKQHSTHGVRWRGGKFSFVFALNPHPSPLPEGEGVFSVQTGNIVYRINRAHGLHCDGKEAGADAVERNQCHGPKNSVDS